MLIRMKNITRTFGPLVANDKVNLTLERGEILAVVGENGAGKSTLMKILYGLQKADSGEILINDTPVVFSTPHDAIANGIGMVQQHFMLFPPCTAAENIVYAHEKRKGIFFDRRKSAEEVAKICREYGLYVDPSVRVESCPVGIQQRIEILKVLYQGVDIIIFDEPSAVLTPQEVDELLETIRNLKKSGKSIILITHKLNEVMAVADRVMVMRSGRVVGERMKRDTSVDELSLMMVGHKLPECVISPPHTGSSALKVESLVLSGIGGKNILDDLTLHVDRGEIVGIAGVSGNGQSELIQCITGLRKYDGGSIGICGRDISGLSVAEIRKSGCACIPEDRYYWGSAGEATLEENAVMAHQDDEGLMKAGFFNSRSVTAFSEKLMKQFDVRHTSGRQNMKDLSGGNAQKLIVAREMAQNSAFLIAAEPTRGIDIGAINYIHGKLVEKRDRGDGILLVSSELSEILELSDRIYVIYEGHIAGEFTRENATSEKIGLLMMGGKIDE